MQHACAARIARAITLVIVAACGDNKVAMDASGACWPLPSTPGGHAELGTGDVTFEPMPDTLSIMMGGGQSDPFLEIHSRIQGIPPGDPLDVLARGNPKTKVTAVLPDVNLTLGIACPASIGYASSSVAGSFDLVHSLRIGFGTAATAQSAIGKQARITLEVVGSNGLYARDDKTVTVSGSLIAADAGVDGM
jgi:hypothetical protein